MTQVSYGSQNWGGGKRGGEGLPLHVGSESIDTLICILNVKKKKKNNHSSKIDTLNCSLIRQSFTPFPLITCMIGNNH